MVCSCGLEACAEELDGGDDGCSDCAGCGAGEEGCGGGAEGGEGVAEGVVAGKVDYVGGDGHEEGWGEAAPEGGEALVFGDLDEAFEGAVYAVVGDGGGDGGGGELAGGEGWGGGEAGGGRRGEPEDFAAAGGHAEVRG